ncbi:MAG TPA: hypothetical protein VFB84_00245 [Micromonosporaceae bacterium]|nr:hypothetical protein [Micromonosporaceae bacterium]
MTTVVVLALALATARAWPWALDTGRPTLVDLIKLALSVTAGSGAAVALVVAYRRQRFLEVDDEGDRDRIRLLTQRFGDAVAQLGNASPAVRLAGAHALAAVADQWPQQRQQCIDVLCGYLRLPYNQDDGNTSRLPGERQVRLTILRIVRDHLRIRADPSWSSYTFDLTDRCLGRVPGCRLRRIGRQPGRG